MRNRPPEGGSDSLSAVPPPPPHPTHPTPLPIQCGSPTDHYVLPYRERKGGHLRFAGIQMNVYGPCLAAKGQAVPAFTTIFWQDVSIHVIESALTLSFHVFLSRSQNIAIKVIFVCLFYQDACFFLSKILHVSFWLCMFCFTFNVLISWYMKITRVWWWCLICTLLHMNVALGSDEKKNLIRVSELKRIRISRKANTNGLQSLDNPILCIFLRSISQVSKPFNSVKWNENQFFISWHWFSLLTSETSGLTVLWEQ